MLIDLSFDDTRLKLEIDVGVKRRSEYCHKRPNSHSHGPHVDLCTFANRIATTIPDTNCLHF